MWRSQPERGDDDGRSGRAAERRYLRPGGPCRPGVAWQHPGAHFQRDFRWTTTDVTALFDSIVKGYPIGSLLLWVRSSPQARITLGSLEIDAPASDSALWVVDGQQRITSLANALHPAGNRQAPFNIVYDLVNKEFLPAPGGALRPTVIPVPVLFDLD